MEEWVPFYQKYKDWILMLIAWLLSIPTGLLITRLDKYLGNRSKQQQIKALIAYYTQVVIQKRELNFKSPRTIYKRIVFEIVLKFYFLIFAIMIVQMLSNPLFVDKFGKHASDLYFYSILILAFLLSTVAAGIAGTEENILKDAIHFSEYRKKTIVKLTKLDYDDLGILDRIDKLIFQ